MAIKPKSLEIITLTHGESSWREVLLVQKQHGLNPIFLQFHFAHIYAPGVPISEESIAEGIPIL